MECTSHRLGHNQKEPLNEQHAVVLIRMVLFDHGLQSQMSTFLITYGTVNKKMICKHQTNLPVISASKSQT